MHKVGIIGGGAWGTALAQTICFAGNKSILWAREEEVVGSINQEHENKIFLPDIDLHDNLIATSNLSDILDTEAIFLVTPAQRLREILKNIANDIPEGKPLVICSKGIEIETGNLLSEVIEEEVPSSVYGVLSGPTFASEIASGMPAAVTIAVEDKDIGAKLVEITGGDNFRPYLCDDIIGSQLGGAVKNVIAVACGVVMGRGLGESARAALMTRGMVELGRLGKAMGAKESTLLGMCGIGDMMLTCTSMKSRNYSLGIELGKGLSLKEIMLSRNSISEGVHTAKALIKLANKNAVDMPIASAVDGFLNQNISIDETIKSLMARPFGKE